MKMVYLNHYKIFLDILTNRSYCEYNIIRILLSISHTSKSNLSLLALSFLGGSQFFIVAFSCKLQEQVLFFVVRYL